MTPTQPHSPSPAFQYVTLKPNGKQPAGGPGWQNRISTGPVPARVADHNIGILGGSPVYPGHRLLVLDVDVKKGKRGQESLIAMQKELGPLPRTVTAITPTGGQHIYLAVPEDVPLDNAFGLLNRIGYPDIDLIGPGRFVVAPPSSIDGNAYEWTYCLVQTKFSGRAASTSPSLCRW